VFPLFPLNVAAEPYVIAFGVFGMNLQWIMKFATDYDVVHVIVYVLYSLLRMMISASIHHCGNRHGGQSKWTWLYNLLQRNSKC
jgi:hypothetical protein